MISGIQSNLIEDVKINHCYFATAESLAKSTSDSSDGSDAGWKTIQVPELEDAYPDLSRFGPMPTNGFFLRHVRNIEMAHVEIASSSPDPRPAFWLEDVRRADFFAITASRKPNFVLRNVSELRMLWSRAAGDTTIGHTLDEIL
jgi:hypothetical protein